MSEMFPYVERILLDRNSKSWGVTFVPFCRTQKRKNLKRNSRTSNLTIPRHGLELRWIALQKHFQDK